MQASEKPFRPKTSRHHVFKRALVLLAGMFAVATISQRVFAVGDDAALQDAAKRLAERVASIPGLHGPLRLEWHPDASWTEGESGRWKEVIEDALERRSLDLTEETSATAVALFAEETPTQVVLTARARFADRDEVRIVSIARVLLPPSTLPVAPIRLERQMIYESPDRILDASSLWNGDEGGVAVLLYRDYEIAAVRVDAKGTLKQTVPIASANLKPTRDPHAEMTPRGSMVAVQLWGKSCEFSWGSSSDAKCHADKSASTGKPVWRAPTLLTSPCDDSTWKLVGSGNEPNAKDILQVVPEGTLQESSAAVLSEFPGPILNTNGEQNPSSALVVSRNLRTGNYEVYKITLACGD